MPEPTPSLAPPTISVITVVYNGLKVLPRTLQSMAEQDRANVEYVVVDGASKDGTAQWLADRRDTVDVLVSEPDRGIYDAMNKGARLATGDYLYFLNAGDTFCTPRVLTEAAHHLQDRPAVLVGRVRVDAADTRYPLPLPTAARQDARALFAAHFCHQALFVSRRALLKVGGFDTHYPRFADFHNAWRVMQEGPVKDVPTLDVAHFSLDGVSSDWRKAVELYREREAMLRSLGFGQSQLKEQLGLARAKLYKLKKRLVQAAA